jgi:hypothetical protein
MSIEYYECLGTDPPRSWMEHMKHQKTKSNHGIPSSSIHYNVLVWSSKHGIEILRLPQKLSTGCMARHFLLWGCSQSFKARIQGGGSDDLQLIFQLEGCGHDPSILLCDTNSLEGEVARSRIPVDINGVRTIWAFRWICEDEQTWEPRCDRRKREIGSGDDQSKLTDGSRVISVSRWR